MSKNICVQRNEYIYDPRSFPALRNNNSNSNDQDQLILTSQRRTADFNDNRTKRSYQQVISTENKKKRIIHKAYDRDAHNSQLYFPNTRPSKETNSTTTQDSNFMTTQNSFSQNQTPASALSQNKNDNTEYFNFFKSNFYELPFQQRIELKKILNALPINPYQDIDNPKV